MNWLNSINAKEIGTLYLIFSVFAGMIGTAFSVLIKLELSINIIKSYPMFFTLCIYK